MYVFRRRRRSPSVARLSARKGWNWNVEPRETEITIVLLAAVSVYSEVSRSRIRLELGNRLGTLHDNSHVVVRSASESDRQESERTLPSLETDVWEKIRPANQQGNRDQTFRRQFSAQSRRPPTPETEDIMSHLIRGPREQQGIARGLGESGPWCDHDALQEKVPTACCPILRGRLFSSGSAVNSGQQTNYNTSTHGGCNLSVNKIHCRVNFISFNKDSPDMTAALFYSASAIMNQQSMNFIV